MLRVAESVCETDTGRQRRENEDSAFACAPLFVVADGMGGARAGGVASRLAIESLQRELPVGGSREQQLAELVREANRVIYDQAHRQPELRGMGTTLTAAYLDDAHVAIAHVGDSRAYLLRDGELRRLTQDHSLVGELVARGKLTEEQAAEHPQRSIITRALGVERDVDVDTWSHPVRAGDVLLLCSDGLTSMVSEERIAEILDSETVLERAARRLIAEANRAGGRDNITVVLCRLEEAGVAPAGAPAGAAPAGAAVAGAVGAEAAVSEAAPSAGRTTTRRAPSAPRAPRRPAKPLAILVAIVLVLFLVGGGGYLATRQLYFIGTNSQGIVTIYRGLPYSLPAGINLYETYLVSGVPASLVPADRRGSFFDNQLRSQSDALRLVRDLELGRISP
jgi:serine/threonine protein phosphatase PrpC